MRKKRIWTISGIILVVALSITMIFAIPAGATNNGVGETPVPTIASETNGTIVNLLSGEIYEFASGYEKLKVNGYCDGTDKFAPTPATIRWTDSEGADYYTVKVSKKADLSDAESFVCFGTALEIEDLFMGTRYYYQVTAHSENKAVRSRIFHFDTAYLPRTIYVEGGSNTRDMGGYYTVDGNHRIKQGMIYRGAAPELSTAAGIDKMLNVYGIKTDLDLRGEKESSALGDTVNFVNYSTPYYLNWNGLQYDYIRDSKGNIVSVVEDVLREEIRLFANPESYPVYVHCSLGRDRTGTICFLIGALCGMNENDLYLDYEMSFMSYWGSFGWNKDDTPEVKEGQFTNLYNYFNVGAGIADQGTAYEYVLQNTYLSGNETTLAEKVESYLKGRLGITQSEIDAIRSILVEEV